MSDNNKLSGKPIDSTLLNLALYGELDPDYPRMSAEERKEAYDFLNRIAPKQPLPGKAMVFSTAGEDNRGLGFKKLWDDAQQIRTETHYEND